MCLLLDEVMSVTSEPSSHYIPQKKEKKDQLTLWELYFSDR